MRPLTLGTLCLTLATAAAAQPDPLARCRAIADGAARLACYDAIPLRATPTPAAVAPPTARPPAAAAAPATPERFGLPSRPPSEAESSITSTVRAGFDGWGPNSLITLDNGQVWQVVDSSSGTTTPANRRVTVRRGALGSFFIEFEGLNKSPRVRRVQ